MRQLALVCSVLSVCGCSSSPDRGAVEGQVLLANGRPLPSGFIRFIPVEGPSVPATITDGKYHLDNSNGPIVGTHRVEITAFRKRQLTIQAEDGTMQIRNVDEQYIPAEYNLDSKMSIEVTPNLTKQDFTLDQVP